MKMVSLVIPIASAVVLVLIGLRKLNERFWGYCENNIELHNKVVVVTGANSGIGYEIAKELALRKAHVILGCRSIDAGKDTVSRIKRDKKDAQLIPLELDLGSLLSIKKFAEDVSKLVSEIHVLINNAGVAYPKKEIHTTSNGFEIHFGINHLGHFYLTNLLLDTLKKSAPSRVIVVSSSLSKNGFIDIDNIGNIPPQGTNLYASSKLANVYFAREFSKRFSKDGINIYAVFPGWVYTSLFRHSIRWYHYFLVGPIAFFAMRSAKQGAQTAIYCATDPSLETESGLIYRNCRRFTSPVRFEDSIGAKLWDASETLIKKVAT